MDDLHAFAERHRQQHGFVLGGVVSYLRPALGPRLLAEATARSAGRRMAVCQCEVWSLDGEARTLCALARGTAVPAD